MARPDPQELLELAVALATDAASLLRARVGRTHEVETKSSLTDMVTATDRASERLVVDGIRRARPDDAILGEEGTTLTGTTGVRWVIDPLDGTTNFLYGLPAFAVSIAVEVDGMTEVGVVLDAGHEELFTARRGGGAWLGDRPIRCNVDATLPAALVGTGFSYDAARRGAQGAVVAQLLPVVRDIRRVGAAAIDLCWVAAGRLDAYYERGLQPWDLAAGALIAAEAGAAVGDLRGGAPTDVFTLAAAPSLFPPLREILRTARADTA